MFRPTDDDTSHTHVPHDDPSPGASPTAAAPTPVAVVGLRRKDVDRLRGRFRPDGLDIVDGGCIDDGSNAQRIARRAIARCSVVVLNTGFARKLPPKCLHDRRVLRCSGLSGADDQLRTWLDSRSCA